ncbi:MAG TPA: hypothetical protein VJB12_05940 [Candidatus Nanoarchaeia archaeon]|nr:hypothetical protein [Candidatus Nanoarchaeia archaeon]
MAFVINTRGLTDALGIILLASGAFSGLSFHATHIGIHGADHSHAQEITVGIVLMVLGVMVLVANNRNDKSRRR